MDWTRALIVYAAEAPAAVGLTLFAQAMGYPWWILALLCVLLGAGVGFATAKWVWHQ